MEMQILAEAELHKVKALPGKTAATHRKEAGICAKPQAYIEWSTGANSSEELFTSMPALFTSMPALPLSLIGS